MNAKTFRSAILSLLALSTGCGLYVGGNGVPAQEVRPTAAFSELQVGDGLRATITIQATPSLVLSGDANLLPLVRTEFSGGVLSVHTDELTHLEPALPLVVQVGVPALRRIGAGGGAEVTATGVTGPGLALDAGGSAHLVLTAWAGGQLTVNASGASRVELSGQSQGLSADLSGASRLEAQDLSSAEVRVSGSGASQGEVCASQTLAASLSGASYLAYHCHPQQVTKDLSGGSGLDAR